MLFGLTYQLIRFIADVVLVRTRSNAQLRVEVLALSHQFRVQGAARPPGIFGRRHLEKVLAEFVDHYNHARPHHGIEQRRPIEPANVVSLLTGPIERRDRLGGLLHEYRRAA